jgi:flagellar biosynthesis/type III secretory pathway M-ring protein FliF/YscJ
MGQALSVLALAAVCAVLVVKIIIANRRAAQAKRKAEEERALRARGEAELRERVERVKKQRDPLELSKRAIADDPGRAAKTLSRMMRQDDGK